MLFKRLVGAITQAYVPTTTLEIVLYFTHLECITRQGVDTTVPRTSAFHVALRDLLQHLRPPSPRITTLTPSPTCASVDNAKAAQPPQAPQEGLLHLTSRPRFMVRVNKSRPAPRVTVEISKLMAPDAHASTERSGQGGVSKCSTDSDGERQPLPGGHGIAASNTGGQGIGGESLVRQEGVCREDKQRSMWMEGIRGGQEGWYQLSCGRLAGMKGGIDCLS